MSAAVRNLLQEYPDIKTVILKIENGAVWCTRESMYQQTLNIGLMISELNTILSAEPGSEPQLQYFFRLR